MLRYSQKEPRFLCGKILQVHRFEEVQQAVMQHWLCCVEFYLVAEDTRVQGLVKIEDASSKGAAKMFMGSLANIFVSHFIAKV